MINMYILLTLDPHKGYTPSIINDLVCMNGCSIPAVGEKLRIYNDEADEVGHIIGNIVEASVAPYDHPDNLDYQWATVILKVDLDGDYVTQLRQSLIYFGNGCNVPGLGGTVCHGGQVIADVASVAIQEPRDN